MGLGDWKVLMRGHQIAQPASDLLEMGRASEFFGQKHSGILQASSVT